MACGIPPQQEGLVPLPAAPLPFSASHVRAGVPQGSVISPALFNHHVSDFPVTDQDVTSYTDFTLLASAPIVVEAKARLNNYALLWRGEQMGSNWPLFPRNPAWHRSSLTSTCSGSTLQCELVKGWSRWTKPLELNSEATSGCHTLTLDTHFTFAPHARDIVKWA